ncbi:MAG: ATP-binding protein [Treponema sp.]|nr:ATP-binding protein [Treponema sp.]
MAESFVSAEQYDALLARLAESEKETKRLARELRFSEKRNAVLRLNYDVQINMTKSMAKEKLKQETYVNMLLQICPDIIFMLDGDLRFLLGTDSVRKIIDVEDVLILHGVELPVLLERYHSTAFTPEMLRDLRQVTLDWDHNQTFLEAQVKDNTYEVHILPFKKADFACILVLMHDITELVLARNLAEMASAAKTEFLSRMSHEMRTPMAAIIGMTGIAQDSDSPKRKEECLGKIDNASKHLLGLINDILDMSKIEADKFEIYAHAFAFRGMIDRVVGVTGIRIEEKKQRFVLDLDEAMPAVIVGDELRLTQVITNLLSNAVKFTPDNGTITLSIKCMFDGEGVGTTMKIAVSDTGIGISPAQQSRLFNAFEQLDGGTARQFGGTGLGLAISKRIVEMMGGNIRVESELGNGSTFVFTVPFEKVADGVLETATNLEEEKIPCLKGHTILIAEDIDINQEIIESALEKTGAGLVFAKNGLEAVSAFEAHPDKFGLILMDIQMPLMDGYAATRTIRDLGCPLAEKVPIIAMTANVFQEDVERCLTAGANGHLGKPLDWPALFKILSHYLKPDHAPSL